jgi:hypothetical protein
MITVCFPSVLQRPLGGYSGVLSFYFKGLGRLAKLATTYKDDCRPWNIEIHAGSSEAERDSQLTIERLRCYKPPEIERKGFGHSCGAGCAPIEAFHKRNSPSISVSSSLCTMPENAGKHCCMHSWITGHLSPWNPT